MSKRTKQVENKFITAMQELNPKALKADGLDEAIVGIGHRACSEPVFVYSREKCINVFMRRDKMSQEEASEFFEYNTLGAFVGEFTPIFMETDV